MRERPLVNCIILMGPLFWREIIFGFGMNSIEFWVGLSLQPWGGYLGRALVFVWDSALAVGGPVSISQKFLALRFTPAALGCSVTREPICIYHVYD